MTWTPSKCTLPTAERPLCVAEFDELFATALRAQARPGPTRLRLTLDGADQVEAINLQTLRYYERRGPLTPPERTPGGHRQYAPEVVTLLRVIKAAQQLGFTLDEVADLLETGQHRHGQPPDAGLAQQARASIGKPFPQFTLTGADRKAVTGTARSGEPSIVWFTDAACVPCQLGAVKVAQLDDRLGGQAFSVVAVFVNPREPLAALTAWRDRYARPDWTMALDARGALSGKVRLQYLDTNDLPHAPTRVLQAILAGLTATAGFLLVFAVVGVPVALGAGQLADAIPWVGFAVGVAMALVAIATLAGRQVALAVPTGRMRAAGRRPAAIVALTALVALWQRTLRPEDASDEDRAWSSPRLPVPTPPRSLATKAPDGRIRAMPRQVAVIGAPSGAGACGVGQEQTPAALRAAGLIGQLGRVGFQVIDLGDSQVVPWRPDRANPRAQNLEAVVDVVRSTSRRVADALAGHDRIALVLGGDCTVGIGTVAGIQQAIGRVALAYFDLHSDLNTPASATDGALDWMALAHMLAIQGSAPTLTAAAGNAPLLNPDQVVLFAHDLSNSTRFERGEIERLGLARVALEEVRGDPEAAASRALQLLADRSDRYAIHLDVDVVDFTDAPLSEHPSRNTGLKLDQMLRALRVLASGPGLVAITLAELNPHNTAADDGLLERFAASLADAIG